MFVSGDDPLRPTLNDFHLFAGGIETPVSQMPRTGTASYSAITRGFAEVSTNAPNSNYELYRFTGAADFSVRFSDASLTATIGEMTGTRFYELNPGTNPNDVRMFDGFEIDAGISGTSFASAFSSNLLLEGRFFGPNAVELGGWYRFYTGSQSDPEEVRIDGVFAGRKR